MRKLQARIHRLFNKSNYNILIKLIQANIKVNDHNSILGILWSFITPVVMWVVMYSIFRTRFEHEVKTYPLYLLIGITSINFFITATTQMVKIFHINRDFILNTAVPREDLIIASMFINIYKFLIELVLCFVISILYGVFNWSLCFLFFPLLIAYMGLTLGIGLIISLVYCFIIDMEYIWGIASRLLLFITPTFYALNKVSPIMSKLIYWCNPLTPFLISFREIFINTGTIGIFTYLHSIILGSIFFILGYNIFVILEPMLAEKI